MTEDEIRAALLGARGGFPPFKKSGHVVVSRDRVTCDRDEVDHWVREHGGWIENVSGSKSQALGTGRWQQGPSLEPSQWYVVPASTLGL